MIDEAKKSKIQAKLSACILSNNKLICPPCCNTDRNIYKGFCNGSIHAETRVILKHYGKNLLFDPRIKRWCLLQYKKIKIKEY
jgi:hypothetical protein